MLTINRLSITALAFAGLTLAAQTSFAAGCHGGGPVGRCAPSFAPSYANYSYRSAYPVQPCYQQPIYYAPSYAPYAGTPVVPVTPFRAAAPVAVNLPPAGPLSAAPVAAQVIPNAAPAAPIAVLPVSNSNVPPSGPLGVTPIPASNLAPNEVAAPVVAPITLPANPQAPRIETPAAVPGPVGALTAYNVGVQGPVSNVQTGAEQPILRAPKFEE